MPRPRTEAVLLLSLALTAGVSPAAAALELPDYVGAGACASSACHGSKDARQVFGIRQDEFSIWASPADRHSKAYETLASDTSRLIQKNLGLEGSAQQNAQCLACHTLDVAPARQGKSFAASDGVSCEACHGPAERWLGPHTLESWTHEQSVRAGMIDTRDLLVRARTCLGCHLGDETRRADHTLIAAGHPDLTFELDTFSATMPPHWKEPTSDESAGLRRWAVGQAAALEASMRRTARTSAAPGWPDFAELECFSCHHGLVATADSERIRRGPGGPPGRPRWNESRWVVFRSLVEVVDPELGESIESQLSIVRQHKTDARAGDTLAASAIHVAETAGRLGRKLADAGTRLDGGERRSLVAALGRDAETIAAAGYRAAEQAALAADGLQRIPSSGRKAGEEELRRAADALFEQVADPNLYDPAAFALALRKFAEAFE